MVVYIEYVILDNFTLTAIICALSYKLLREKARKLRIFTASLFGTACAICYPFIKSTVIVLIFKLMLCICMCLILYIKLPHFFAHSLSFLAATATLGGFQFMIGYIVHGSAYKALRLPVSDLPLSIFVLAPLAFWLIAKKALRIINAHRLKQNYIFDVKLTIGDKQSELRALVDTGNSVKADKDVIFIGKLTALDMLGGDYISLLRKGTSMSIHTAAGTKKIILLPGKIELYLSKDEHIFMDVQVGIGDIINREYEALLPLSILGKEKAL